MEYRNTATAAEFQSGCSGSGQLKFFLMRALFVVENSGFAKYNGFFSISESTYTDTAFAKNFLIFFNPPQSAAHE